MATSYFIARLVGPVFTVIGIALFISRAAYRHIAIDFLGNSALIYGSGVLALLAGLAILNLHNRWTRDWRSLITAIGWVFATIGVFRIFAPDLVMFVGAMGNNTVLNIAAVLLLVIGAILTFKGYVAAQPQSHRREINT